MKPRKTKDSTPKLYVFVYEEELFYYYYYFFILAKFIELLTQNMWRNLKKKKKKVCEISR